MFIILGETVRKFVLMKNVHNFDFDCDSATKILSKWVTYVENLFIKYNYITKKEFVCLNQEIDKIQIINYERGYST